jgi:hypothetical protein
MGRKYVSELRLQTGLLFILQMIYEHGESQWNDIDKGKLLIRPPELSPILPAESSNSKPGDPWQIIR